ncbi:MAG: disulfide bond formation protein B [Betaproteobacteria bacterium]
MNRYASIPWPWAALFLSIALAGQELLLRWLGAEPSLSQAVYRVSLMTLGFASLALILLPPRRPAYLLGFLVCAALMAWAFWLQYGEGLEPCPLCMFQRVAVIAVGIVFLIAAIHNPRRSGAAVYAMLTLLIAGAGAAFGGRQIWLQSLPKDKVPSCGMGLNYMMDTMPFMDVFRRVLEGSGECAEKGWVFLGLSIAGWTFVFFASMIAAALALIRRD